MGKLSRYFFVAFIILSACTPAAPGSKQNPGSLNILTAESFLADITRNIAGNRAQVDSLIPEGMDPHAFELTPQDIVRITECDVFILNGGGLEGWAQSVLKNIQPGQLVLEASQGLAPRLPEAGTEVGHESESDPHFWLDPVLVIHYVENIRNGLIQVDSAGESEYTANAENYIKQLKDLDAWIQSQVDQIPVENKLLVTNHESFGYFADRYGFKIVGTIIPSVSTGVSPSARQLADLINHIRETKAPAIFIETGANPQLAIQVEAETGAKVVTGLNTHSIQSSNGQESSYIAMMKWNVTEIVNALK